MADSLLLSEPSPSPVRQTLLLNSENGGWRVVTGALDVFVAPMGPDGAGGPRRPLFRVGAGGLVLGFGGTSECAPAVLAVSTPGTELERLPEIARGTDLELLRATEDWVAGLLDGADAPLQPRGTLVVQAGAMELPGANQPVCTAGRLLWASAQGPLAALDEDRAADRVAITGKIWARVPTQGTVVLHGLADVIAAEGGAEIVPATMRRALDRLADAMIRRDQQDAEMVDRRRSAEMAVRAASAAQLATLLDAKLPVDAQRRTTGEDADALLACCRRVVLAQGLRPSAGDVPEPAQDDAHAVSAYAEASGLRARRIALERGWWRSDVGPFVGRTRDGQALALVRRGNRYVAIFADGREQIVGTKFAAGIRPAGYVFYGALPIGRMTLLSLVRVALRSCHAEIGMIVLAAICPVLIGIVTPMATGLIFDTVIPQGQRSDLTQIMLLVAGLAIGGFGFKTSQILAQLRLQGRMDLSMQAAIWDRILTLPVSFFRRYAIGDLTNRALGINALYTQLTNVTLGATLSAIFSIVSVVQMFVYSWQLALASVAATLLALGTGLIFAFAQLRLKRHVLEQEGVLAGRMLQFVRGMAKLRMAGVEGSAYAQWAGGYADQMMVERRGRALASWQAPLQQLMTMGATMLMFWLVTFRLDGLALGTFAAFTAASGQFSSAILGLANAAIATTAVLPLLERTRPILEGQPETAGSNGAKVNDLAGRIDVSHVSFSYPGASAPVLSDLSISIAPGEFLAIVGGSGSGKSTILRLLLGFETPAGGKVSFDGQDLDGLDLRAMRRQLGVVLQNGALQPGSIFDNIVGMGDYTMQDAWEAAEIASVAADIRAMPMGMHTLISEAGGISGGQKQRLMIARAVVNRPRVLFFDEATSALDNTTQAQVSRALEQLQATRIVVAHRLSTVVNADRIIVLDKGRIVESGRYEELMAQGGFFAELARRQVA